MGRIMTTNQVLITVGLAIVVVLLIVLLVTVRRRKARAFAALTPEERELKYAKDHHASRMSELKGDLKATDKESRKRTKHAESRLAEATKMGSDKIMAIKAEQGTVTLTGLTIITPSGTHDITPETTASVSAIGAAPATEADSDTRRTQLTVRGAGFNDELTLGTGDEAAARAMAAKISSAASHVETLSSQRDEAITAAEAEVAEANANATIEANNAKARHDAAEQESLERVRAAEDAVRLRGINPK